MADQSATHSFVCAQCGKDAERPYRGSGVRPSLCSNACKVRACRANNPQAERKRREVEAASPNAMIAAERLVLRRWARRAASRARAETRTRKRCRSCGTSVERNAQRCSGCRAKAAHDARRAYRASEAYRAAKRAAKAWRRGMERGSEAERFDPFEVFERDRWRCHLCGVKTPKTLRGSYDDRAPELDHVVPLALGGQHTRANTACSCRRCNIAKGAKALGQMRLNY